MVIYIGFADRRGIVMEAHRVEVTNADHGDWLGLLRRCGGYYRCPQDAEGRRIGPLVGYAGKYKSGAGELQYVGTEYANFAKAERFGNVLNSIATALMFDDETHQAWDQIDGVVGMPMGGLKLAGALSVLGDKEDIYPESIVDALKTETTRQQSHLEFVRHAPTPGKVYALVEDVCNNFSTTEKGIMLIEDGGGKVEIIACFLNRSPKFRDFFPYGGRNIPIVALVNREIQEYEQRDPVVADDVQKNNVVWKPKNEWHRLETAMTSDT